VYAEVSARDCAMRMDADYNIGVKKGILGVKNE